MGLVKDAAERLMKGSGRFAGEMRRWNILYGKAPTTRLCVTAQGRNQPENQAESGNNLQEALERRSTPLPTQRAGQEWEAVSIAAGNSCGDNVDHFESEPGPGGGAYSGWQRCA